VLIDGGSLISSFRLIIIQLIALRRKLKYAYNYYLHMDHFIYEPAERLERLLLLSDQKSRIIISAI